MAAWKSIRITKPCKLSIESGNLVIKDETHKFKLSLSDTDSIVSSAIQKYTNTQCKSAPLCNTYLAEISNNPASRFCFSL